MELLFSLNVVIAVALTFWPVWFSRTQLRLPWLNPLTIALIVALPVQSMKLFGGPLLLIEDGLFDTGYQFALLMGSLFTLAQLAGMVVYLRACGLFRIERLLPMQRTVLGPRSLRRGAVLFLLVFGASMVLLASAEFGVLNWLANPREGYQLYRTGQGHWYALAASSLAASFLLAALAWPRPVGVLWCTVFYLGLGYMTGSKATLLAIFTAAVTFLWFLGWRHLASLILIGTPLLMGLMLVNVFLALADGFQLQTILEYFDFYKNAADYYGAYLRGEINLFLGDVSISALWAYVPRAIWPDKPAVYGVLLVNEIFYPGQAELTNTPAFAGAVEQFADFGVVGVLIFGFFSASSFVTAVMSFLIFRRPGVRFDQVTMATVLLLLVQYAPGFGLFLPGGLYALLLLLTLAAIALARVRRRRRLAPATSTAIP